MRLQFERTYLPVTRSYALLIFAAGCLIPWSEASAEKITVRALSSVPDNVIEYIAKNSELIRGVVKAGELPEKLISQICGNYTKPFERIFFQELNPALVREPKNIARTVRFPACLKWRKDPRGQGVPARVMMDGETLEELALRKIGKGLQYRLACSASEAQNSRCGQTLGSLIDKLNSDKNLNDLRAGEIVFLPLVTERTTITLREGLSATEAIAEIARLGKQAGENDSPIIVNEPAKDVWLLSPVDSDFPEDNCWKAQSVSTTRWPYDPAKVVDALRRSLEETKRRGAVRVVTVSVIDSGLSDGLDEKYLKRNLNVEPRNAVGIGVHIPGDTKPFPDHVPVQERLHGTQVAHIVTGGSGLRAAFPELNSLLRVNIVKVLKPTAGSYEIQTGDLSVGVDFAINNADIGNISIASFSDLPGLRDQIARSSKNLFVVAAGNNVADVGDIGIRPAMYGGRHHLTARQIITVGAHDASLGRASFSNVSKNYVDLFAPGCDIPYAPSPWPGVHGTSFAAPLVSMTAALLMSLGLQPEIVKQRIVNSVDFDPNLQELVVWSGRLNIAKAIYLYDDIVERKSTGQLLIGTWDRSSATICEDRFATIKKISATKHGQLRILYEDSNRMVWPFECDRAGDGVRFVDLQGFAHNIAWDDLVDLVAAEFPKP